MRHFNLSFFFSLSFFPPLFPFIFFTEKKNTSRVFMCRAKSFSYKGPHINIYFPLYSFVYDPSFFAFSFLSFSFYFFCFCFFLTERKNHFSRVRVGVGFRFTHICPYIHFFLSHEIFFLLSSSTIMCNASLFPSFPLPLFLPWNNFRPR